jgi:hypothetical protein
MSNIPGLTKVVDLARDAHPWWLVIVTSLITAALIGASNLIFGAYSSDREALRKHQLSMESFEWRLKALESRTAFPMEPYMQERIKELQVDLRALLANVRRLEEEVWTMRKDAMPHPQMRLNPPDPSLNSVAPTTQPKK